MTIKAYDWISGHANQTPNAPAIEDLYSNRTYTYAQMNERIGRLADHLSVNCDIERGDRVAVISYNNPETLELQFACQRLGAIFVPLNFRLTVPELEYIVSDCGAKAVLADIEFEEAARSVSQAADVQHVIITNSNGSSCDYELALAAATPLYNGVELTLDDPATIMYTSGTTGHPKGAIITYSMVLFNAINYAAAKLSPDSVQFTFMPLFHTGGLNVFTLPVLLAGGKVILTRAFDAGEVLDVIDDERYGVTHFLGVPAMMLFMSQHPNFNKTNFSRLVAAFVGGAPVPVPVLKAWINAGANLQQGYGMTETGPSCLALMPGDAENKVGSTGKPVMHVDVKIVDNNGEVVPTGTVGELWVKGPTIIKSYWNKPEANKVNFTDGWLHTGDAARVDEDGFYFIVDRTKDMYISGGENVYPAEVENILYQIDGVIEAAVIGIDDAKWGETGCAIVVTAAESELTENTIISYCAERLAKFKLPKSVVFTDVIPRNATGKVLKNVLRETHGGN